MINNVFSERKMERKKSDIDVNDDSWGLLDEHSSLAKVSQFGWLGMPTKDMPSQFVELGMVLSVVHNGSWMNIISKLLLTSRIVLIRKLFFQKFCKNIFKSFKIILWIHSQLNESNFFSCPEFWCILLCVISCWNNASRMGSHINRLDVCLCS